MNLREAHTDYSTGVSRLMIHHAWHLTHHAEDDLISVESALDDRIGICLLALGKRPFELKDTSPWDDLRTQLADRIEAYAGSKDSTKLEDECWKIVAPLVTSRIDQRCEQKLEWKKRPFGCWTFALQGRKTIDLHFANVSRPRSPFKGKTRERTANDLLALLTHAHAEHPKATRVRCGSWLSCFPPFNELFPEEWAKSYKPVFKAYNSAGWWGQYEDRRGALHTQNAQSLRQTGQHPYIHGVSVCTLEDAIDHLKQIAN